MDNILACHPHKKKPALYIVAHHGGDKSKQKFPKNYTVASILALLIPPGVISSSYDVT
jgi:hypothetical protein